MLDILMGGIGLRPGDIEKLSPDEVEHYVRGFLHYRRMDHRAAYESGRLAGFIAVMPYLPKHVKNPSRILRFPWDPEAIERKHSKEHIAWVLERDKVDIEKALRGEGFMKVGTKGYKDALNRLFEAGIKLDVDDNS